MSNDLEFEAFLRRFRPVAPGPLPTRRRPYTVAGAGLAAALACLALAAAWWARDRATPHDATAFAAARASLDDPARLESVLEVESRRLLTDVRDRKGALRRLASLEVDR